MKILPSFLPCVKAVRLTYFLFYALIQVFSVYSAHFITIDLRFTLATICNFIKILKLHMKLELSRQGRKLFVAVENH